MRGNTNSLNSSLTSFMQIFFLMLVSTSTRWTFCQELADGLPCDSKIFCDGPLLEAVQNAYIYNDSKTFVDLHLKCSPDDVLTAFDELEDPTDPDVLRNFVATYFDGPGLEFIDWVPTDWKSSPAFLEKIKDDTLKDWARDLQSIWKELGRKIDSDVKVNQDRYTLIYVEEPFIVPGGRFREFYYWDSYWVIKGLLISELTDTVRGMLLNFAHEVERLGFVPNGNRIYYERRSQPPFFIPSVYEYLKATDDLDFVKSLLPAMEKEYLFWMSNRTVDVQKPGNEEVFLLNRYDVCMGKPRPESFREDVETCTNNSVEESARICSDLASGAESGWDFSTRWLGVNKADLKSIRTKRIVPVDLNSILCLNEKILYELFTMAGESTKADVYMEAHIKRRRAIQEVFWVEENGAWFDFDLDTSDNRNQFFPSNIMPMWANCFADGNGDVQVEEKVLSYLQNLGVLEYPGGIPTSLLNTGQQWDYPNAWPPLQEMVIHALASSSLTQANDYAFALAQNWTTTNWRAYEEKGVMFEKYNVENQGVPGHGGEYDVQAGFGWTNGVVITLLDKYGDQLTSVAQRTNGFHTNTFLLYLVVVFLIFVQ